MQTRDRRRGDSRGRRRRTRTLCGLLAGLVASPLAGAAWGQPVHVQTETREAPRPGAPEVAERKGDIWLDGQRMRMRVAAEGESAAVVVFRGDRDVLWTLDSRKQTYMELDRESVAELGRQLESARSELEARLETLPPDERLRMRLMMEQVFPEASGPEPETRVAPHDERRVIRGRSCRRLDLVRGDERVGEIWLAEWADLGVDRRRFDAFRQFAGFQRKLLGALGQDTASHFRSGGFDIFDRLDGFPMVIKRIADGAVVSETRFGEISDFTPSEGFFEIPDGYTRAGAPPPEQPRRGMEAPQE